MNVVERRWVVEDYSVCTVSVGIGNGGSCCCFAKRMCSLMIRHYTGPHG